MLTPLGTKIIIQPIEADHGKIIVQNAKPAQYRVIAIGDEVTKIKPNDIIYLEKHYGAEIKHNGESFLVIELNSILAKLD